MFRIPAPMTEITMPARIPPAVSTEKEMPGVCPVVFPASVNFMNVKPYKRQKGRSAVNVKIRPAGNEGVSPGLRISLVSESIRIMDKSGPVVNKRLIFPIPETVKPLASAEPSAEPMSQEHRNEPAISS